MTGWQGADATLAMNQPIGTDAARADAIVRWKALPPYVDVEIGNLREGTKAGYTAPKGNVEIVIDQMTALISTPVEASPFGSPAVRDPFKPFQQEYVTIVSRDLIPAFKRYRDFLQMEYLPAAREAIAVSSNPSGVSCYGASLRSHSTLSMTPQAIHEIGQERLETISTEMKTIAERSFKTSDVPALLQRLRNDPSYKFKDRQDLIAYSRSALDRARTTTPGWFGILPKADVVLEPHPSFREKTAANAYYQPGEDGSHPGVFFVNAYQAELQSHATAEAVAFHETVPGHHLQIAIALERNDIHSIGRYLSNDGYTEGWGLYSERLADEMHLYSSDLDRLGMLSGQSLRAARLVVDTGVHAMGWTRQQAIDYLIAHSARTPAFLTSEVDRYIIWPGQATGYMLGMLEILAMRTEAQHALGARFDMKTFHDRVLEDGAVPLPFLHQKIRDWAQVTSPSNGR